MVKRQFRRAVAMSAAAGALAAGLAVTSGGVAQAATPGHLTVCTEKNFSLIVTFPDRGGLSYSPFLNVGHINCGTVPFRGDQNERIDVYTDDQRYLGSSVYNGTRGAEVRAVPGPSFIVT